MAKIDEFVVNYPGFKEEKIRTEIIKDSNHSLKALFESSCYRTLYLAVYLISDPTKCGIIKMIIDRYEETSETTIILPIDNREIIFPRNENPSERGIVLRNLNNGKCKLFDLNLSIDITPEVYDSIIKCINIHEIGKKWYVTGQCDVVINGKKGIIGFTKKNAIKSIVPGRFDECDDIYDGRKKNSPKVYVVRKKGGLLGAYVYLTEKNNFYNPSEDSDYTLTSTRKHIVPQIFDDIQLIEGIFLEDQIIWRHMCNSESRETKPTAALLSVKLNNFWGIYDICQKKISCEIKYDRPLEIIETQSGNIYIGYKNDIKHLIFNDQEYSPIEQTSLI